MAQYELNIIDYWLIVKKRKYLILLAAGLVVLFTFLFSEMLKPSPLYEASARVKFDRTSTVAQQLIETMSFSNANDLNSQTEFIRGFPVMERDGACGDGIRPSAGKCDAGREAIGHLSQHGV